MPVDTESIVLVYLGPVAVGIVLAAIVWWLQGEIKKRRGPRDPP